MAGFKYAIGDIVMTMDTDLQNISEEIPKLLVKTKEGYDILAGKRVNRKDKYLRKIPSHFMKNNNFIINRSKVK